MEQSEVEKLEKARDSAWGPLGHEYNGYPSRIVRLEQELRLWLDGETIEYVRFGHEATDGYAYLGDATELNAFILTRNFAVAVVMPRDPSGSLGQYERHQVLRTKLTDLKTDLPPLQGLFEGLTFRLSYEGIPREITVKLADGTVDRPDLTAEQAFFGALRNDLYAE